MANMTVTIQSRTTGRLLLVRQDDTWHLPYHVAFDPEIAHVGEALDRCRELLGKDDDRWLLDWVGHNLFHLWVEGEPSDIEGTDWFALFEFPESLDESVDLIFSTDALLKKVCMAQDL